MRMMGREGGADREDEWWEAQGFSLEGCQSCLSPEINFPRSSVKQSERLSQLRFACLCPAARVRRSAGRMTSDGFGQEVATCILPPPPKKGVVWTQDGGFGSAPVLSEVAKEQM